jgi:excisionase family DNA binding protein
LPTVNPGEEAVSEYLTIEQAAELLQVTDRTCYEWARTGRIPAAQIGGPNGRWRISRLALEAYVASGGGNRKPPET